MNYRVVTDNTLSPIGVDEIRDYLRIDHTTDDELLDALSKTATKAAEVYLWKPIMAKTYELSYATYKSEVDLQYPATAVSSISYYDTDNNDTALVEGTDYNVYLTVDPVKIEFENSLDVYDRPDAIRIRFTVGATDPNDVDPMILQAIRWAVAEMYERRVNSEAEARTLFEKILHPIRQKEFR